MQLSDAWMIFTALAFVLYIVLDGYDLGIGALTLVARGDRTKREMHALCAWLWDGNESWLVLVALALWTGVPLVVGVALPALYIPLVLMLFSLIARGVAIEMIDQYEGWHPVWGRVFGLGSLLAGFCQGAAFGGLVAGLHVQGGTFIGGPFTFLHDGYAVLTGLTAVALYVVVGAAWLSFKTTGSTRLQGRRAGRVAVVALAVGTAASWLLAPAAGPVILHVGAAVRLGVWVPGAVVLATSLLVSFRSLANDAARQRSDRIPMYAALGVFGGGLLLAGGLLYPELVPPSVTVHSAASPDLTLLWLVVAGSVIVPINIAYQALGYWIFRGTETVEQKAATA